jgi:hypothetical protein
MADCREPLQILGEFDVEGDLSEFVVTSLPLHTLDEFDLA